MPPTLNLVGCGRVGATLGRLWQQAGVFTVQDVHARRPESMRTALDFIGAGRACTHPEDLQPAEVWLFALPDGQIAPGAQTVAALGHAPAVALHCSGFLPASTLAPLGEAGWALASVHPALSFATPAAAVVAFPGTPCAVEGDSAATARLQAAFEAIGARCFPLTAQAKTLHHTAAVLASNFLPVLADAACTLWDECGVPPELRRAMLRALVLPVARNVVELGAAAALTGPASRGDRAVVEAETEVLRERDPGMADAYARLSEAAAHLALSRRR